MGTKPVRITLAGNPNCGKTELFNALTGSHQRVGNWPGVTVEKKTGSFEHAGLRFEITDLPGIYSLDESEGDQALDSTIACQYLRDEKPDVLVNVVNASQLKRHLFLTTQLTERNIPMVLAVNMMDVADKKGLSIELKSLSKKIGCPVIGLVARRKLGIEALREAIHKQAKQAHLPKVVCRWPDTGPHEDTHLRRASVYHHAANYLYQKSVSEPNTNAELESHWLDRIVLNRYAGIPIFLAIMYLMFVFSINVGGAFQDFFDISSNALFVRGTAQLLQWFHVPLGLIAILSDGFGGGVNTVLTFIPVIAAMFLFLSLLEDSGYLSRAAFVMDRLMQKLGLPGQSFIPLIVGFGCNVPAVMGARTLPTPRDRILTILMTPFISCGARLAIFAVFASAFFPHGGQNIIFLLYLIGLLAAIGTGFMLRRFLLPGKAIPLIMELPEYHLPSWRSIRKLVWQRLKSFLSRAGRYIIPICILIGGLNTLHLPSRSHESMSVLSSASQAITPLFAPMGIRPENWPATVGLATGILAKEVVVGTLNTLYSTRSYTDDTSLSADLKAALISIPTNLLNLNKAFSNPFVAAEASHKMSSGAMETMINEFSSPLAAFAYLVFVLLYFPCISTLAAMMREIPRDWSIFSVVLSTALAYASASCIYQLGTLNAHPIGSLLWVLACAVTLAAILQLTRYAHSRGRFTMSVVNRTGAVIRCTGCSEECEN
jgi:ferrous iron transport protein B